MLNGNSYVALVGKEGDITFILVCIALCGACDVSVCGEASVGSEEE